MAKIQLVHPQEVEVLYIIPAIRRELTLYFKEKGIDQKKIAVILQVSEPAISQYVSAKRGNDVEFPEQMKEEIRKCGDLIQSGKSTLVKEMKGLLDTSLMEKITCAVHAKYNCDLGKDCRECFAS